MEVIGGVHHAHAAHQLVPLKTRWEAVRPLLEILHRLRYSIFQGWSAGPF